MKLRSFFSILAIGAIAIFAVGIGGLYWIFAQSPISLLRGGVNVYPEATVFIPKQAPAAISLLVNPEKLEALRQLKVPLKKRRQSREEWNELKTNLLAKTGLNYQKDIKPWLGEEITLAVTSLDYDRDADNGIQPGYLLATATKNTQLAKEFLQVSFSERAIASDIDLVIERYKGVGIISQRSVSKNVNSNIWASAVVGNFVLFSNHPQILKEAINSAQAIDLNLSRASYYQSALDTIVEPRIGLAYVNLPGASAWLDKAPIPETPNVEQTLTVTLSIKQAGLIAETALIGIEGKGDRTPALEQPVSTLSYLPPTNIATVGGRDLAGLWQKITTGIDRKSPLAQLVKQLVTNIESPLGIDLAEDIFSWVKGEYSLALVADAKQNNNFSWLFVAESNPSRDLAIDGAIAHLDDVARQQGLTVSDFEVSDRNITAWTQLKTFSTGDTITLNADVKGAHLRTKNYVFLASSLEAIATALDRPESWLDTSEFQKIALNLPQVNDGYVYINFAEGKPVLEKKVPLVKVVELAGQSLFSHLRAVAIASQGSKAGVRRATILLDFDT